MRTAILALAIATSLSTATAAPVMRVGGEPAIAPKATAPVMFRSAVFQSLPYATLRLQMMDPRRVTALRANNAESGKRLQIGIGRQVADEAEIRPQALQWRAVAGGAVARLRVEAPDAKALRVGFDPTILPPGAEIRVAGSALPGQVFLDAAHDAKARRDANGLFWTAVTDGGIQELELFIPQGAVRPDRLPIESVSHLVVAPASDANFMKALGRSGSCNVDVVCRRAALGQAYTDAENAVAHMVFTSGSSSYVCTGTLLNDNTPATQVPYFYSAAHCLDTQTEANTLQTYWEYETATCGVVSNGARTQLTGGATLLFANATSDVLLLRLNGTPPAGAFFAGWDANTLTASTATLAIHHPAGDNKKSSLGSHSGFSPINGGSYARSSWTNGTTEGGSSGSGLFTLVNGQYLHRGGLYGGQASCSNVNLSEGQGNVDYYSRLDQAYPSLQQWLGTPASTGPTRTYDGAWYNAAGGESGWGVTVFQYTGQIFILAFLYDNAGRPNWYRLQGAWTGVDVAANLSADKPALAGGWTASFNAANVGYTAVGTGSITFTSATQATFTLNAEGVNRTVTLTRIQ